MRVAAEDQFRSIWREIDYEAAWRSFDAEFDFKPNFSEAATPAIRVPEGAVIVDLRPVFAGGNARFAAGEAAINAAAARSFVWLCDDEELIALDWQHPAYSYSPARHALSGLDWSIRVFPNGDYYAHMTVDLRWGTFGHPWQQWLCVWGQDLVDTLAPELAWLPTHPALPGATPHSTSAP